ncbi:hypothetical protein PMAYCL1PPCAC_16779, partial [Pristionchus mayeri]
LWMQKECAICCGPLVYGHLGINSCRACAVFYKRAIESKTEIKCKEGDGKCMENSDKTACRFCRFARIKEILRQASEDPHQMISRLTMAEPKASAFLNHESFYDCEPTTSRTPTFDRLRKAYSLMCLIRYGGELGTRTKVDERLEIHVRNLVLVPATYSTYPIHDKTCKEAMKAFASHAFEDYRKLDEDSREFLIRKACASLNSLDAAYRSMHNFPNDPEIRTPSYTTYLKPQEMELFLAGCTDDVDVVKISEEIRKSLKRHVNGARGHFKQFKPNDFVVLLGLSLWNEEISEVNEKFMKVGMKNRVEIMRELHVYYSLQGTVDYAARIGHLYCILVSFQDYVVKMQEDLELCKLMNLYKDYIEKNCDR